MNSFESIQKEILSPNIKLLGDILGEVLLEQGGKDIFEKEEYIRSLAKRFREKNDLDAFNELQSFINDDLSRSELIFIIKAFSHFFKLVNLAEEYYKIEVNKLKEENPNNTNTISYALEYLNERELGINILETIKSLKIRLIWTAHPTEARRLTILMKLREIFDLLKKIQSFDPTSKEFKKLRLQLKEQVTLMWQSDELREEKVELLDEVRTVLFYFDNTLFDIIPNIYEDLCMELNTHMNVNINAVDLPKILEFGSWVGGDRDGHPDVTAEITIQTLLIHKRLCLRKYLKSIEGLIQHLSSSTNIVNVSDELRQSLSRDEKALPDFAEKTKKLNKSEPYRKKLDFMRLKLENTLEKVESSAQEVGLGQTLVGYSEPIKFVETVVTYYQRSTEFLNELNLIRNSLLDNRGKHIADGLLSRLIVQVQVFGFHLAPLDLRQDANVHFDGLVEIFEVIGLENLKNYDKEEQCHILERELLNPRPLGIEAIQSELSSTTYEVYKTLRVAKQSVQKISPRCILSYVISMSTHERDVLVLMLLMKEVGLIELNNGEISQSYISIAPLFETKEDLENAPQVMDRLFSSDLYRSYLKQHDNMQEIMIGYSDSTKDVGIMESNFRLLMGQKQLVEVAHSHGLEIRIFHGRGGSISRGGGPTNRALLSQPPNSVFNVKITEQGEVIGSNYSNHDIAYSHLEGIISAMLVRGIGDRRLPLKKNPARIEDQYLELFRELAAQACTTYESMVKQNSKFIPFYMSFTPLDLIERATIGSRPSRRTKSDVSNIGSLRAIPWVFSWTQTRLIFPAYYGLGSALKVLSTKMEEIQEMYDNWPYFQTIINKIQMVMLKADLNISSLYLDLLENEELDHVYHTIATEYKNTLEMILKVSKSTNLMDYAPDTRTSIRRRNPYIDPLNVLQVRLLKEWRENDRPIDLSPRSLLRNLLQTLNGVASGLKNTG